MFFEQVAASLSTLCLIFLGENCVPVNSYGLVYLRPESKPKTANASSTQSTFGIFRTQWLENSRCNNCWGMEKDDRPGKPIVDYVWQPVGGAKHKFYVYSAYCDSQEHCTSIRVIAATKRSRSDPVQCKVRYSNNVTLTSPGQIQNIEEHHDLMYTACFIRCPLIVNATPDSVAIITSEQLTPPTNRLRVIDTKKYDNKSKHIGICVKPLHYLYNKTIQLVEFMELNRILGMDHVTFYNSSISRTTDCILRKYMDEGRATVLPWKDHFVSQQEIRTENLFAALNDCLYRNKHNFSHIAFLDMDEFIMPTHDDTIQQLLKTLDNEDKYHKAGSYNFRNAFFYLQWPNDPSANSSKDVYERTLTTLLKTRRMLYPHKHAVRSKYIVKPAKVVVVGNHQAWQYEPGYKQFSVNLKDGILSHYRICEFGGNDCVHKLSFEDRTALRYKQRLLAAVKHRWQELQRICKIGGILQARELVRERD